MRRLSIEQVQERNAAMRLARELRAVMYAPTRDAVLRWQRDTRREYGYGRRRFADPRMVRRARRDWGVLMETAGDLATWSSSLKI